MKGVKFGEYHSWDDFSLILAQKIIGTPQPKTEVIDIPGGDGVLDLTEFFGEVKYSNRPLTFEFSSMVPQEEFMDLFSRVQNALHGQKMKVVLDDDPESYYTGRITVSEWKADRTIGKLTIDCDCEPYKHWYSSQAVYLTGENLINLDAGVATTEGTWTKIDTGYNFTRGTITGGSFLYWTVPVRRGQQYTFSASNTSTTRMLYVYKDKLYGDLVVKEQSERPCIFTATESGLYVFGLYATSQATAGDFTDIMLREGGTVGEYVAYDSADKTVTATFSNTRQPAVPAVYVTGTVTVESSSVFLTLQEGLNTLSEFTFYKGDTTLTFNGNGVAVVEWLEGGL